jgi:eukaryotic-like serine/threonine-protein kinase
MSDPPRQATTRALLRGGFLVADKYGLVEPLGSGSMGSVWKAVHAVLGHAVAIKFLHASVEASTEARARFEREAKLSARLGEASRHITRVTDYGVIGSGTPFVVMELLQGEELSARLSREQRLPLTMVSNIVSQLARALSVAHGAGVIHRDLKPANVFLTRTHDEDDLLVKLLDFGVAKASLENEDAQATRAGTLFGTPGYMSPEQIVGDMQLDPRADLWSVAVMVYRMTVGRTPFGSGGLSELGLRILSTDPQAPSSVRADLPPSLDAWMKKALAKRREDRFQSAMELASALDEALGLASPDADAGVPSSLAAQARAAVPWSDEPVSQPGMSLSALAGRPKGVRFLPVVLGVVLAAFGILAGQIFRSGPPRGAGAAGSFGDRDLAAPPATTPALVANASPEGSSEPMPTATTPEPAPSDRPAVRAAPAPGGVRKAGAKTRREPASDVQRRADELWKKKDEL